MRSKSKRRAVEEEGDGEEESELHRAFTLLSVF
jgi:hypothetical protein